MFNMFGIGDSNTPDSNNPLSGPLVNPAHPLYGHFHPQGDSRRRRRKRKISAPQEELYSYSNMEQLDSNHVNLSPKIYMNLSPKDVVRCSRCEIDTLASEYIGNNDEAVAISTSIGGKHFLARYKCRLCRMCHLFILSV